MTVPGLKQAISILLVAGLVTAAAAQSRKEQRFDLEYFEPLPDTDVAEPRPSFQFKLLSEIPLPGPLPGGGPYREGDRIAIAVDGGTVFASSNGSSEFLETPVPLDPLPGDGESSVSPDGRVRCRTIESGWILAEKKCTRCKKGWRKKWKLRAPGSAFARPLVTDRRIFYGTTDNRVYCVKRGNGHRVWVSDVDGRVLRPLELLRVPVPPDPRFVKGIKAVSLDLVLVVPDDGASMVALDARNGERVAAFELPENETLIGGPLATPHGKIAVARQRYNAKDAALLFFDLKPPPEVQSPEQALAYNGERSPDTGAETAPPDRPTSN